ncbi:hypothetical protein H0H93_000168 [Arthromyces matolae]|nr:hypothetical protein H0H93_000168 [Arthromyces matolae]
MDTKTPVSEKDSAKKSAETPTEASHEEHDVAQLPSSKAPLEEYLHYAALQRHFESGPVVSDVPEKKTWMDKFSEYKGPNVNVDVHDANDPRLVEDDAERVNAARALRTASWASVFFLITTDILGPFNAPFAISQVGWVPGVLLYFFMGLAALYCGLILWRLFIRLDSIKYPLKTYGDIAERIFGKSARHVCTILQSLQLAVNVGTICLSNGQALSQISKNHLCFAVCIVIWAFVGMVIGQIRTLKNYGWLANCAVWINLLIIFISMGVVAHTPPNFEAASRAFGVQPGPVVTHAFVELPLFQRVNGIMNMVFAYGGAMIFPEMMAEMRRPMDFWKGMAFQGQFTLPLAYQGLSSYAWQTVGNVLSLITGIIAAGLYGNIGIKVVYINIVENWFHGPPLLSRKGRYVWSSFIIGSAIPQVQTITGLIAAIAIMQFSYTFPFFLRLGYDVMTDAMASDQLYVPGLGTRGRVDTWKQWSRWRRGLFSGRWYFKLFNLGAGLGGLAMACLVWLINGAAGMWGAGESIKATFQHSNAATSFGCNPPV